MDSEDGEAVDAVVDAVAMDRGAATEGFGSFDGESALGTNEEAHSESVDGSRESVGSGTNMYWAFEVVFLSLIGVAIVFMFISQRKEQDIWDHLEHRQRKYGFNRIDGL